MVYAGITQWVCLFLVAAFAQTFLVKACNLRLTDEGSVCVCNASSCDTVPSLETLEFGQYQLYTTSKANLGFSSSTGTFSNNFSDSADVTVTIASLSDTHQTIMGFGGAFTDSTGINILNLSSAAQENLLQAYFGEDGIQYSLARVPMAGSDFSLRGYTYCDEEDETLDSFALQTEDYTYKIPFIQRAIELRGQENISFLASAWSAPPWMKTSNALTGIGSLKSKYYDLWAQYYLKFFEEYEKSNISFWAVTTQNEPIMGILNTSLPNTGFTSSQMKKWIKEALGPRIRNSSYSHLKIVLHDDGRHLLVTLKLLVLSDREVVQYADGIALHWYEDALAPPSALNLASSSEKYLFRISTEACNGFLTALGLDVSVRLGSWDRGEYYLDSIFTSLSYDFVGWIDWNMVLDETGGPNWIDNQVDAPILVNGTSDEFYKQPMFYVLGHFSKFIVRNSVRITTSISGSGVDSLAFLRPDNKIAVVLRNTQSRTRTARVHILDSSEVISLEANSINTLLYTQ